MSEHTKINIGNGFFLENFNGDKPAVKEMEISEIKYEKYPKAYGTLKRNIEGIFIKYNKQKSGDILSKGILNNYDVKIIFFKVDKRMAFILSDSSGQSYSYILPEELRTELVKSLLKDGNENIKLIINTVLNDNKNLDKDTPVQQQIKNPILGITG